MDFLLFMKTLGVKNLLARLTDNTNIILWLIKAYQHNSFHQYLWWTHQHMCRHMIQWNCGNFGHTNQYLPCTHWHLHHNNNYNNNYDTNCHDNDENMIVFSVWNPTFTSESIIAQCISFIAITHIGAICVDADMLT